MKCLKTYKTREAQNSRERFIENIARDNLSELYQNESRGETKRSIPSLATTGAFGEYIDFAHQSQLSSRQIYQNVNPFCGYLTEGKS